MLSWHRKEHFAFRKKRRAKCSPLKFPLLIKKIVGAAGNEIVQNDVLRKGPVNFVTTLIPIAWKN